MQKVLIYIALILSVTPAVLNAQHHYFRQYSLEEGLPQSEVNDIVEDEYGYLWLGTNGGGLCKFNGTDFEILTKKNGLLENLIIGLYSDNNYNLWIANQKGITKYNGKTYQYIIKSDTALYQDRVQFLETIDGSIWVVAREVSGIRKLIRINDDKVTDYTKKYPELSKQNKIFFVCKEGVHSLYVSTSNGLYSVDSNKVKKVSSIGNEDISNRITIPIIQDKYRNVWAIEMDRPDQMKLKRYNFNGEVEEIKWPNSIQLQRIFRVYEDRQGAIWISVASQGIIKFKDDTYKIYNKQNGLNAKLITSFCEDREGNMWLGSSGSGVLKYGGDRFISFNKESGLSGDIIRSIFEDSKGNFYFGDDGNLISKYDGKKITVLKTDSKCIIGQTRKMIELANGNFLIGTTGGLFEYDGNLIKDAPSKYGIDCKSPVTDILKVKETIWFAVYGNGLLKYTNGEKKWYTPTNSRLNSNYINNIFIDSHKRMWISTTKGIFLFENDKFTHYSDKNVLNASWILQAAEDKVGNIWFATFTGGLNQFDGNKFHYYNTSNGITSENIYSVIADAEGNIWAGTQNGVDKINIGADGSITSIQNFDKDDGFIGIENNGGCNLLDNEGRIWFGTIKGAMRYNPEEENTNYLEPPVYVKKILLNFKNPEWSNEDNLYNYDSISTWFRLPVNLELNHTNNHIGFVFDALCYTVPEKIKYKWKLEPIEKEWSPENYINNAIYPSLTPGKYTFKVIACNNDGVWNNEGATYSFEIVPAWYQYNWIKAIALLFILSLIFLIVRQIFIKEKILKQDLESRLAIKKVEIQKQQFEIEKRNKELKEQKSQLQLQSASLQTSNSNLERLTQIGQLITANLSVDKISEILYESVSKVMSTDIYNIAIYNKETKSLDFVYSILNNERQPFTRYLLEDKERLATYAFTNNSEVFINNFYDDYKKYIKEIRPVPTGAESESVIYIPLRTSQKVIGIISVQSLKKNAYTPYHLNFMQNIANYASIAIGNALKYQNLVNEQQTLKTEHEIILGERDLLNTEKQELADANYEINQLLSLFAKEIQQPLNKSISEISEFIDLANNCTSEQKKFLSKIYQSLKHQNKVVSNVLEVHNIDRSLYDYNPSKIHVKEAIESAVNILKTEAEQKNITLTINGKETEAILDLNLFLRIIENLVSNAIKYSPKDKFVRVIISEHNQHLRIEIRDEGPGLTEEEKRKIFEKYSYFNKNSEQEQSSSGLGLYIVNKYLSIMNGSIRCESIYGLGASFIIEFPMS